MKLIVPHEPEPLEQGKGAVHFFPGGMTEHAVIQLSDGADAIYSVEIHPLTGRAQIYPEAYEPKELLGDPEQPRRVGGASDDARLTRARATRAGFTLLEVMVAVAILALSLTAIFASEAGAIKMAHALAQDGRRDAARALQDGRDRREDRRRGLPAVYRLRHRQRAARTRRATASAATGRSIRSCCRTRCS